MRVTEFIGRSMGFVVIVAALASSSDAPAQGADQLWEVTMKMDVPGMPMAMPAQVHRVCVARNHRDEDLIPRRDNCRLLDSRKTGNRISYTMACTGAEPMNIAGEMTYASDNYEGRMRMTTSQGGQSMEMAQTFAGKRVGACTANQ